MKLRSLLVLPLIAVLAISVEAQEVNELTPSEASSGWKLLFDGENVDQWRGYRDDVGSDGWVVRDGELIRQKEGAGDLISRETFQWFELLVDFKISKNGNSGIMFHVDESGKEPWSTGPEIQILDNAGGKDPQKSGWLYQLYKPSKARGKNAKGTKDAFRGPDQWNQVYVRIAPSNCEVCLNGVKYYNFEIGSKDWKAKIAASKFANFPNFGSLGEGHLCLQDHGDEVAFRNIKVRVIDDTGEVNIPNNESPDVASEIAFPQLQWDDWQPVDDSGRAQSMRLVELTHAAGQPQRLYAVSQAGEIWTFENRPDVTESSMFLDLRGKVMVYANSGANEQGLLGLAMHPDFEDNGLFYTYHNEPGDGASVITQWSRSENNALVADPDSGVELLRFDQPYGNHNGGSIVFGPDGYLYAGIGDGGSANDPHSNGQNIGELLGSVIRIDVSKKQDGLPYAIPADNPLVNVEGARPEIYAWGFRNPWRLAFDPGDQTLWTADVGQDLWEEIDIVTKGGNYGWSIREGWHAFGSETSDAKLIEPIWEYDHQQGKSITGGKVYRGSKLPSLAGKYIYADYVSGTMWALTYDAELAMATKNEVLLPNAGPVLAFSQDASGEVLYMVTDARGEGIRRLVPKKKVADVR